MLVDTLIASRFVRRPAIATAAAVVAPMLRCIVVCTAVLAALPAAAQTQAAGLWEHTVELKSVDADMEATVATMREQLAALPPEQRAQMALMLARRGVNLTPGGAVTVKACVTPQAAARPAEPRLGEHCAQQVVSRSGETLKLGFECTRPQPMRGEAELTFLGDRAYAGHAEVVTPFLGKPRQATMSIAGRWLEADCGAVRPPAASAP